MYVASKEVRKPVITAGLLRSKSIKLREVDDEHDLLQVDGLCSEELRDYLYRVPGCREVIEGSYYPICNQAVWIPIMLLLAGH